MPQKETGPGPLRIDGGRAASDPAVRPVWSGESHEGPILINDPGRSVCGPVGLPGNFVDIGSPMEFPAPADLEPPSLKEKK